MSTATATAKNAASLVRAAAGNGQLAKQTQKAGRHFLIKDSETGKTLPNRKFVAMVGDNRKEGTTDTDGYAHVEAEAGEAIRIHLVFEAPKRVLQHKEPQ